MHLFFCIKSHILLDNISFVSWNFTIVPTFILHIILKENWYKFYKLGNYRKSIHHLKLFINLSKLMKSHVFQGVKIQPNKLELRIIFFRIKSHISLDKTFWVSWNFMIVPTFIWHISLMENSYKFYKLGNYTTIM